MAGIVEGVDSASVGAWEMNDATPQSERQARRAARATIAQYHEEQLGVLLEHVRAGFARLDAGEIDVFELDDLVHRYKRSARALWNFCGSSGGAWLQAAAILKHLRDQGDEPDWWAESEPRRR
jgi:hypothetical protein